MANPDPKNQPAPTPKPENVPAEQTPPRRERLNANLREPSNMGHVWGITFALIFVAVISFFRISGLRGDVDSLKATSATKAEVKKGFEDFEAKVVQAIANSEARTDVKIVAVRSELVTKTSALDSAVVAAKKSIASVAHKAATTSTALVSLTTRVGNTEKKVETLEGAPAMFTPYQLARLKTFADTPPAAPPVPAAPATTTP